MFGVILLFSFSLFRFTYFNSSPIENISNPFVVIEDYDGYVILENKDNKFIFYDDNILRKGNSISIKGEVVKIKKEGDFNEYLKTQNIHYSINGKIIKNDGNISTNDRLIDSLLKNKDEENKEILKLILFNKKSEKNKIFYKSFDTFSLNFMIVVSGFHINLLFKLLEKTKAIKYFFVIFYVYLLDIAISSLKSFLYYVLKKINKKCNMAFNNTDLLSIIIISLLFINPSYCFNLGFIYTFVFSISIDIVNNILNAQKRKNKILTNFIIYLISVPFILLSSYEVNILSFFMTILLSGPISILFVFSIVYLFFDKFYFLYKIYYKLIYIILNFLSENSISLVFGKPSMAIVLLLFSSILLFLYLYQNKYYKKSFLFLGLYFLIITYQFSIPLMDFREIVYFIDVGQGDCIALKLPNSKSVVLIDTGGSQYRDIANRDIAPFLKRNGINNIETIVITHDDFDHNGALLELKNIFDIKNVIDDSSVENVKIGKKVFENLNVSQGRKNDDSIVLYGEYGGLKYLFAGDISKEKEVKILAERDDIKVDVLKVGHHGSNTSCKKEFIESINPIVALIGVGKNNIYKHPSEETLQILKDNNIKIYRTDLNGDIIIYKSLFTNSIIIEKEKDMV